MLQLITRRRSVTNAPPTLIASTASAVSALLIGEPTPFTKATPMASQVPASSTSLMSVQLLSARQTHRRCRNPEPSDHISAASIVEVGAPSQRLTCSRMFTFDPAMRPLSSFMLLWWKSALLFSTKQHHSFSQRPRSRMSLYPRMQVFRS